MGRKRRSAGAANGSSSAILHDADDDESLASILCILRLLNVLSVFRRSELCSADFLNRGLSYECHPMRRVAIPMRFRE